MADLGKPVAHSYAASQNSEVGVSPLHFGDKCFLCSQEIGETDPRQFYRGNASMAICHTGCLNVMNANGGKPADYHRAVGSILTVAAAPPPTGGPAWLDFPSLTDLQSYTRSNGDIPATVKVTVGGTVIQEGR